ncbi:MAG: hypothetical protein R2771_15640 [Saprospiraceae bacterium]
MSKIKYQDGNYIEYTYYQPSNQYLINEIKYTGNSNTGLNPYNLIKFYYNTRYDNNEIYIAGSKILNNQLLNKIEVKAENQLVKNYELYYAL